MKNISLILCEDISVDRDTGQWSTHKHMEKINLVVPPERKEEGKAFSIKGRFKLLSFWSKEKGDEERENFKIKCELLDDEGKKLMESPEYEVPLHKGPITKHRISLDGLVIKEGGQYTLKLLKEEESGSYREENSYPFEVLIEEKEETEKS